MTFNDTNSDRPTIRPWFAYMEKELMRYFLNEELTFVLSQNLCIVPRFQVLVAKIVKEAVFYVLWGEYTGFRYQEKVHMCTSA